jgi:hypothetical protein
MPDFLLLLHQSPNKFQDLSPEEIQKLITKYKTWREDLVRRNKIRAGHKLTDDVGRRLRIQGEKVSVTEGPFSESQEVLGGFFAVEAADYDEAVEIARTCPHLTGGQWIEVRQVDYSLENQDNLWMIVPKT